jgi:APA family basic amino acid/polyamine antiporter
LLVTSLGAIFLALVFAQLSSKISKQGGPHVFVQKAFGDTAAFYTAWSYWVLAWLSNTAIIIATTSYATSITSHFHSNMAILFLEGMLLILVCLLNLQSLRIAGHIELGLTILKLLPLAFIPLMGIFSVEVSNFIPFNRTPYSLLQAVKVTALLSVWGFVGLETGVVPGSNIINAKRTIPFAVVSGTIIAAFIYILGLFVIMGVIPVDQLMSSRAPYADLASRVFGGNWNTSIAIIAIICCLGTLNGWVMVTGRIALGAANDKLFPKIFSQMTKEGAPKAGIIISAFCSIPFILMSLNSGLLELFNFILEASVTLALAIYIICIFALLKMARKTQELTLGKLILSFCSLIFALGALSASSLKMALFSLVVVASGVPVRFRMAKNSATNRTSKLSGGHSQLNCQQSGL